MLTLALPKGRILDIILPMLQKQGFLDIAQVTGGRELVRPSLQKGWQIIIVRAYDVTEFVEQGGADVGITGKDVIMEHCGSNYYELLDLGISKCKLMTACLAGQPISTASHIRVASKFPNITKEFFAKRGQQAEVIKLHGAMELAPVLNMANCIVDVVDTGKTLKSNGLQAVDTIAQISSRVICNKSKVKTQFNKINSFINELKSH